MLAEADHQGARPGATFEQAAILQGLPHRRLAGAPVTADVDNPGGDAPTPAVILRVRPRMYGRNSRTYKGARMHSPPHRRKEARTQLFSLSKEGVRG
jgi:hypothetical protein